MNPVTVWVLLFLGSGPGSSGMTTVPPQAILYFQTAEDCYNARRPIFQHGAVATVCQEARILK